MVSDPLISVHRRVALFPVSRIRMRASAAVGQSACCYLSCPPSRLLTGCCCFYDCDSWYSAHMGTVLRNTTSPNQFLYRVSLPCLSLSIYSPAYINHSLLPLHFCCACITWKYKLIFRSVLLDTNIYEVANHIAGAKQCQQ